MIDIKEKKNCCGCSACVQVCPKQCITFDEDKQGFRYPLVNKDVCIDCGLCEKVCPAINQSEPKKPLKVYAAKNPNEYIRMKSSSGGVFTMLAEAIIEEGGVVFGARFNEHWEVIHAYTETKEGLEPFRGSKYVQSIIGNTYVQAKEFLLSGRKVLFTGTPCQIAGLKKFLRKDYENLFTVDVVCHGVPSPLVWRSYMNDIVLCPEGTAGKNSVLSSLNERPVITGVAFRDKTTGWKKYGFVVHGKSADRADKNTVLLSGNDYKEQVLLHETLDKNLFMQVFLKDLCLRPSCTQCPAKRGKSTSDITLADYWGISNYYPEMDDDKGTSLILINNERGKTIVDSITLNYIETHYLEALSGNPSIEKSISESKYVLKFWENFYKSGITSSLKVVRQMQPSYFIRGLRRLKRIVNKILK